ncbi:hypothetical protein HII36_05225 [Nonomuraea sp. NN258]|uniref:hypothetical protein n=1 Tax=Nonomuraea antri TaxID=2730852 RepID=UPI001569AD1D|nr:hypothetical protein [Nonomuraea antri]NRQ31238.1 hypothetical protein [Nonomuraea antri]
MSESYADHAERARKLLARSSPGAARAMRVRELESARPGREVGEWWWKWVDEQAEEAVAALPRLVEAVSPEPEREVVDEEAERRRVALARARMRARLERTDRQNDNSDVPRKAGGVRE